MLAELEDFLPKFLVFWELLYVIESEHVSRRGPYLFHRLDVGMGRRFAGLGKDALAFFADGPTGPQQSRIRVWGSSENRDAPTDLTHTLCQ